MNRTSSNSSHRLSGDRPQGHVAALIVILLVIGLGLGGYLLASGWTAPRVLDNLTNPLAGPAPDAAKPAPDLVVPPDAGTSSSANAPALALASPDWDVAGGRFFTQGAGPSSSKALGYSVTNAESVAFWDAYQAMGGVPVLGYPVSQRFQWDGMVAQAFQKAVLQWNPTTRQVQLTNVLDDLSAANKDSWLESERATPLPLPANFDDGKTWDRVVADRLALLDADPALKAAYYSMPEPTRLYGLPTSQVTDMGSLVAIRTQRTVLQRWTQDVPWARAGQVTAANAGSLAVEAGLFPKEALGPEEAPAGSVPLLDQASPAAPAAVAPIPASVAAPSASRAASTPAAGRSLLVANTDGQGVYLRRTPQMEDRLRPWQENTRLQVIEGPIDSNGQQWYKVKDPAGNEAYVPAQYVKPAP